MRRPRLQPLILCVLCLLGAQQAANAHFVSHLGSAAAATAFQDGNDKGNGEDAPALNSACRTCAAFAALVAAPPVYTPTTVVARVPSACLFVQALVVIPACPAPPYATRAPPAGL